MAKPAGWETILDVGAFGGGLTIVRRRAGDGAWRFVVIRDESSLKDFLDEDDQQGLVFKDESGVFSTFEAALQELGRYPWQRLYPLTLHPDYRETVLAEVSRLGGADEVARWESRLSQRR